jgi:hypothetical protein
MPPNFKVVRRTLNLLKQLLELNHKLLIFLFISSRLNRRLHSKNLNNVNSKSNSNGRQIPYFLTGDIVL